MRLIYEKSQPGRRASVIPRPEGLPAVDVPEDLRRAEPPRLPEVPEFELIRHFTELSTRNYGIDTGFYPLGSCTMKYNPRVNERLVALPGFAQLHPHQEEEGAQGALELEWRLQEILGDVDRRQPFRSRDHRRAPARLRLLVDQPHVATSARTSTSRSISAGVRFSVTATSSTSSMPS